MEENIITVSVDNLVSQTKRLGWNGGIVQLDIDSGIEESTKLLLLGKILSNKSFPRTVVKDIVGKAWNLINEVEVKVVDRNVFIFAFNHEADLRRAWDRRPWSIKGEHLILKKFDPNLSLNEVDFTSTEFWVQIHGLPLNRQKKK